MLASFCLLSIWHLWNSIKKNGYLSICTVSFNNSKKLKKPGNSREFSIISRHSESLPWNHGVQTFAFEFLRRMKQMACHSWEGWTWGRWTSKLIYCWCPLEKNQDESYRQNQQREIRRQQDKSLIGYVVSRTLFWNAGTKFQKLRNFWAARFSMQCNEVDQISCPNRNGVWFIIRCWFCGYYKHKYESTWDLNNLVRRKEKEIEVFCMKLGDTSEAVAIRTLNPPFSRKWCVLWLINSLFFTLLLSSNANFLPTVL